MFKEVLTRFRKRAKSDGVGGLLSDLSEQLRSDAIPGALKEAAHTIASLIDGQSDGADGTSKGAVIINISVAVAVGAPGKQKDDAPAPEGALPNEALVIATAVATAPALPKQGEGEEKAEGKEKGSEKG